MSTSEPACAASAADFARTLIASRRSVLPKRLHAPGPDAQQQTELFQAAAAAPDHGQLVPWRFVVVPVERRAMLGEAFAQALRERDAAATDEQLAQAREKAFRAPFLALVVARLGPAEPMIEPLERVVAVGAALQNLLLLAHAMGFGAGLTSGQALRSAALRRLFALAPEDQALCFVNIGTPSRQPLARERADPADFVSVL